MRQNIIGVLMVSLLALSTSVLADTAQDLMGTWSGSDTIITSKSIKAANGDFNKAVLRIDQQLVITAAKSGVCLVNANFKVLSKVLLDTKGHATNQRMLNNMPCLYDGNQFQMATDNDARINCTINGTSMTCLVINARPDHQAATVFHFTKQAS